MPARIRLSAASARLEFHGCEPDYIRDVCHGACCRSGTIPMDKLIAVQPWEQATVEARGGDVRGGTMVPVHGRCPFQAHNTELCWLHGTGDKPGGCTLAPWSLTVRATVIVHNRYKMLRCFRDKVLPAYDAFASGLRLLYGADQYTELRAHLVAGGGDWWGAPTPHGWATLRSEYQGRTGKVLDTSQLALA